MRNLVIALLLIFLFSTTGCTAPTKTINGVEYKDYGLFNQAQEYSPTVRYEPNWWNIVLGVVFCELIVPPLYVLGWHFMEPVAVREVPALQKKE